MPAVRPARESDVEALVALWLELVAYHRSLDPHYPTLPELRSTLRTEIRRGIRSPACELLVAESDERAAGFLFAELDRSPGRLSGSAVAWIHELFVAEPSRRAGLGRALVEGATGFFEARQAGRIAVRVESGNRDGLAFWERIGFEDHARILELAGAIPRR